MKKIVLIIILLYNSIQEEETVTTVEGLTCDVEDNDKEDCHPESGVITQEECENTLKCCYKQLSEGSDIPWCFRGKAIPTTDISYSTDCEEKCLYCNEESKKLNLCISCNENKNYFKVNYNKENNIYYECLPKNSPILKKFYFNETTNEFRPCYETCGTCEKEGDEKFHNCLTCDINHMFRPDETPKNNCIAKCKFYYISPYGQIKCLDTLECPEESKLLIKEKNECTDDCKKDDIYKYQYNGKCLQSCPENTESDANYLCKEIDIDKCKKSENQLELSSGSSGIETLEKAYSEEFAYTNNHISEYRNSEYIIIIYKEEKCLDELSINVPKVDFGNCMNKVKSEYTIINENLIIVVADKLTGNNPSTSYSFFHPKTGEKLEAETICKDETIIVEENLLTFLSENDTNYELMLFLTKQNINIFNISDEFYKDICFEYESPINKDIPLQDRIATFYPNVTLCDNGCTNSGINLEDMTAKCNCKFNDITNNDLIKENVLLSSIVGEVVDIINDSNIAVLKCYKYFLKYFPKRYGGYITLVLMVAHIILTIIFFAYELDNIRKYIFNLTESYISYISPPVNTIKNAPPPKKQKIDKNKNRQEKAKTMKINKENQNAMIFKKINNINSQLRKESIRNSNILLTNNKSKSSSKDNLVSSFNIKHKKYKMKTNINSNEKIKQNEILNNLNTNNKINKEYFNEYLATSIDDMEYDDAVAKDTRTFCNFFYETLKEKQRIANTFIASDPLKTRTMKIMIFILDIILYLVVNGLFFSESYVSEVYNLEGEEEFFDFVSRSINRFVYTTMVSIIVGFIVEFFFIEEKKIKGIFIREKDNGFNLKGEIVILIREMERRYMLFVIIVFIILIIGFYYLLCFNYVYPHMQIEWIKSSIVIVIILQVLSMITCFLETVLRFISFYYKSERIFKISKLIN